MKHLQLAFDSRQPAYNFISTVFVIALHNAVKKQHRSNSRKVTAPYLYSDHYKKISELEQEIIEHLKPGVGKLRPAGRMRPSRAFCAAREHFLKLCNLEINTTRGLTRRRSDGVLKKMAIASTLDGKCVRQLPSTKR